MTAIHPRHWLKVTAKGLYCEPGDFHIDPVRAVDRAVITHGHGDHARSGHRTVLTTPDNAAIMATRLGNGHARAVQGLAYGETVGIGPVSLTLVPAGHILGSSQIVMEYAGSRAVVSGDYKRQPDPTCAPFEPVPCDVFVTEATFGLPVFHHPPDDREIARLTASLHRFPERCHLVGAYALGKCQRLIALLRRAGYDAPIYLHPSLMPLTELYTQRGIDLGDVRPVEDAGTQDLPGAVVLCPPPAMAGRWTWALPDVLRVAASGWMSLRARASQSGAELRLVVSDHAGWDELLQTVADVDAPEVWVTHGYEEALIHAVNGTGRSALALSLVGRDTEES